MQLQTPVLRLTVEAVSASPPGVPKAVVQDITFELRSRPGTWHYPGPADPASLPWCACWSASGNRCAATFVCDGAALDQWASDALGRHIGYLPQDVELLAGTGTAENIARFEPNPDNEAVDRRSKSRWRARSDRSASGEAADTPIGEQGSALSAGQAQRVALARAVYRDPFLVVLDEPNSNLDSEGEEALTRAILGVRERMGIVIVVAHRPRRDCGVRPAFDDESGARRRLSARRTRFCQGTATAACHTAAAQNRA